MTVDLGAVVALPTADPPVYGHEFWQAKLLPPLGARFPGFGAWLSGLERVPKHVCRQRARRAGDGVASGRKKGFGVQKGWYSARTRWR